MAVCFKACEMYRKAESCVQFLSYRFKKGHWQVLLHMQEHSIIAGISQLYLHIYFMCNTVKRGADSMTTEPIPCRCLYRSFGRGRSCEWQSISHTCSPAQSSVPAGQELALHCQ